MLPALNRLSLGPNQPSGRLLPTNSRQGVCVNCKTQPQGHDPTTGRYYPFCSNACAANAISLASPSSAGGLNTGTGVGTNVDMMCSQCMIKPRYNDGMTEHPYCGRTCANLAKGQRPVNGNPPVPPKPVINTTNPTPRNNRRSLYRTRTGITSTSFAASSVNTPNPFTVATTDPTQSANSRNSALAPTNSTRGRGNRSSVHWGLSSGQLCQTPGCGSPVHVNQNGFAGKYCTKVHQQFGETGCIFCRGAPMDDSFVFCEPCHKKVLYRAPMIIEVPQDHERFRSVALQFQRKWLHTNNPPEVRAVYKIVSTRVNIARYERYLNRVEAKGNFALQNKTRGNENRRWHGTTRKCYIGDQGVTTFCSDPSCSLCCIMKTSFDLSFFAKKTHFGRFGAGIYTSSTSSKSDCYSHNHCTSEWKAMLLNKVVVGRGSKMKGNNTTLTAPPVGYDSVIAEVGGILNYDELVVYNNDAIRPSYLVMYDIPNHM